MYIAFFLDRHAFQVLRSKNITLNGYGFLVLEVRVPADGLSRSSNWCFDYQYLCEDFNRRPTGCGETYRDMSGYADCRLTYNSDMDIGNTLGCNPSLAIINLAKTYFSTAQVTYMNAFGFHRCRSFDCSKTLAGSEMALYSMAAFRASNTTTFYTVCR